MEGGQSGDCSVFVISLIELSTVYILCMFGFDKNKIKCQKGKSEEEIQIRKKKDKDKFYFPL